MQFRLLIEYDGTDYQGWQIQPDGCTIQATVEHGLMRLLGHPARAVAAGRTDAGVHAAGQVVCFHTSRQLSADTVQRALNALTPADVAVRAVDVVPEGFDPRRAAKSRLYTYRIWNRPTGSPFWRRYAWHIARPLADEAMGSAAAVLVGEHDFTSFRAAGCDAAEPIRCVYRSHVERRADLMCYEIEATGFLRHMVRNIVGTLVEVGQRTRRGEDIEALLRARDRTLAGITAPAHGLCLMEIKY